MESNIRIFGYNNVTNIREAFDKETGYWIYFDSDIGSAKLKIAEMKRITYKCRNCEELFDDIDSLWIHNLKEEKL